MTRLRVWLLRLSGLFRTSRRERALDDEIQAHLDELTDDLIAGGMSRAAAVAEARRQFGGVDRIKESYRDQRGWPAIDALRHDLVLGLRQAWRERRGTALAVLTLGAGIGVSMAFFTIVNAICFRGLPIDRPEDVLVLSTRDDEANEAGLSYADFIDVRRNSRSFEGVGAYSPTTVNVADRFDAPERLTGSYVAAGTFRALGVDPAIGREFRPADEVEGAPIVVVLGHAVWQSRYDGDPDVVGRSLRIDGSAATIVGVMPAGFRFPGQADAWMPLRAGSAGAAGSRTARTLAVFARLRSGVRAEEARQELALLARDLQSRHPAANRGIGFTTIPINDRFNGRVTDPVWLAFLTAGVLVLIVSCANVANLQLARLAVRSREVALRLAMGATRLRVMRQVLLEALLLAVLGGLAGLVLAVAAVQLLAWSVPASTPLPYWIAFTVDARVLAALVVTCGASVLFFGMAPVLRSRAIGVNELLKDGGRGTTAGRRTRRLSAALMVLQIALTLVLLANVSMDVQHRLLAAGPGIEINPEHLLSAHLTLPAATYSAPGSRRQFFDRLGEGLARTTGIAGFTVAGQLPPDGGRPMRLRLPEQALGAAEEGERVFVAPVGPRYFETLRVPLVAGREPDASAGDRHVLVNQHLAARIFGEQQAVGRRVAILPDGVAESEPVWRTITGVTATLRQGSLTQPMVYVPLADPPSSLVLLLRTTGTPASMVPLLREVVASVDPDLPVSRAAPLATARHESSWMGRASSGILWAISTVALVLAVVGLYAVVSQMAAQRSHEIGIRLALGATPARVAMLVLRRGLAYVAVGLAAGIPATYVFARMFVDTAASPSLASPANLLPVVALLIAISLTACAYPALRTSRIRPSTVLRAD